MRQPFRLLKPDTGKAGIEHQLTPLLRYDFRIIRNNVREAFARKRDWLPFLIGLPLLAMALLQAVRDGPAAGGNLPLPALLGAAGFIGLSLGMGIGRRLDHLGQHSMVARSALQPRQAVAYALFWHAPAMLLLVAGGVAFAVPAVGAGGAYLTGAVLAPAAEAARRALAVRAARERGMDPGSRGTIALEGTRRRRLTRLLARRAGLPSWPPAGNALLFAGLGAAAGLPYALFGGTGGAVAAGIALLALLALLSRQHPPLWRYLLYLGQGPLPTALIPAGLAAGTLAGFTLPLAATNTLPLAALTGGIAVLLGAFVLVATLRALHYATKPRRLADIAFQIDLLAFTMAGLLTWVLAPVLAALRLAQLHKRARSMKHQLA